jgi:spore germination cell wall hydrolase CwlJ-like protein
MSQTLTLSRPLHGFTRTALRWRDHARTLVRANPREAIGLGIFGFVSAVVLGSIAIQPATAPTPRAAPPAPPPMVLKQIAPEQALKVNAEIPLTKGPNPAASPFAFSGSQSARAQALQCLASAVYYEAGNQDVDGERAVAQVVLNRVRHPAFPNSVCGVVYQGSTRPTGCQFTFTCDGSLAHQPLPDAWRRAYNVAEQALAGYVYAPVGWATHYHADYVVPTWASSLAKNAVVGAHIFYRWAGGWGRPAAFADAYAGREPNAAALRKAALAAPHVTNQQAGLAAEIENIPGAEPLKLTPSMRGDKRVAVRFNLVARKASEEAPHEEYAKKFDVSDNLKYALSSESVAENQQPLGKSSVPSSSPHGGGPALASATR